MIVFSVGYIATEDLFWQCILLVATYWVTESRVLLYANTWKPLVDSIFWSEKWKGVKFILAFRLSWRSATELLSIGHKNSNAVLETDRPTLNNKTITPVIFHGHSSKNSQGHKTDTMWEAYFLGPRPELSAASGYTSRPKPDAPVWSQMESTTDVVLSWRQSSSGQPCQPIEHWRSASLRQKKACRNNSGTAANIRNDVSRDSR